MGLSRMAPGRVMTVTPGCSLAEAARLMHMLCIGALVITDEESGKPIGIVTDRDLVTRIGAGADPSSETLRSFAERTLHSLPAVAGRPEAIASMKAHGVRRVPLLDEAGDLVGIVSLDDLLLEIAQELGGELSLVADAIRAGFAEESRSPSAHERAL
jgi:CBS domain-containing protein